MCLYLVCSPQVVGVGVVAAAHLEQQLVAPKLQCHILLTVNSLDAFLWRAAGTRDLEFDPNQPGEAIRSLSRGTSEPPEANQASTWFAQRG